ncbi:MAG: ATP-dependent nuclease [Planctomycetota bacterium]|jgi:hypothetical protein
MFKRLFAERDIQPEAETSNLRIHENGQGLTNTIRQYLNLVTLPSALIEDTLLSEINSIVYPDAEFTHILVQQNEDSSWEIHLEEADKGRVRLSHSGSGLKTIILVLSYLYLFKNMEKRDIGDYFFAFEEIENNIHPSLQRRLLSYIRKFVEKHGCYVFFTTHSNVFIDFFSNDKLAQVIHLTHDRTAAQARTVRTYFENKGILDDLDIRASDILQSNGIVWIEGPSDRLYFNRWIELFTDGEFREGAHYQCVPYGGRLLAHLSARDPDIDLDEVIKILRVNRNAVILIDSDKRNAKGRLNETKRRIRDEVRDVGGMPWITKGREIENYIPASAVERMFGKANLRPIGQFQDFSKYLDRIETGAGERFKRSKVLFAERICSNFETNDSLSILDLREQLAAVVKRIGRWNGIDSWTSK